jgi:hypothetical protein
MRLWGNLSTSNLAPFLTASDGSMAEALQLAFMRLALEEVGWRVRGCMLLCLCLGFCCAVVLYPVLVGCSTKAPLPAPLVRPNPGRSVACVW